MKKGVLIGIIISIVIVIGVALAQVSQDDKSQVNQDKKPLTDIVIDLEKKPQSFTVGLSESMGVNDRP